MSNLTFSISRAWQEYTHFYKVVASSTFRINVAKNLSISTYASTLITAEARINFFGQSGRETDRRTFIDRVDVFEQGGLAGEMMVVTEDVGCQLPVVPSICNSEGKSVLLCRTTVQRADN